MIVPESELIQQQRLILRMLHNAVEQYQQQIAQAKERLEHTLKQIQADKAAAEQEAKREYEQARDKYITAVIDYRLPKIKEETHAREAAREELRAKLLSTTPLLMTGAKIDDVASIKSEMRRLGASKPKAVGLAKSLAPWIVMVALILAICAVYPLAWGLYVLLGRAAGSEVMCYSIVIVSVTLTGLALFYGGRIKKWEEKEMVLMTSNLSHLAGLYQRSLELAAQQAQTRSAEAQRAYQQALGQVKQQFLNSMQQLRPTMFDHTTLTDQTSPPWQSEAWQNWKPGTLTPGVVRLGVFTLQPDQLEAKPVKIGEIVGIANAKLVSNSGGTR